MRHRHRLAMLGAFATGIAWPTYSPAQDHAIRETQEGYAVEFADSDLLGHSLSLEGHRIPIRSPQVRVRLIRPRVSFVVELQKSVEHM